MGGELLRRMGEFAIFLLCTQTIIYLKPKEEYDKYLRFLVNLLILLQLLLPLRAFLERMEEGDFFEEKERVERQLEVLLQTGREDFAYFQEEKADFGGKAQTEIKPIRVERVVIERDGQDKENR